MLNDLLECRFYPQSFTRRPMSNDMEKPHAVATAALQQPTVRWVTRRKAALIAAVRNREITLKEACRQYQLSPEEFAGWLAAFEKHGIPGLRVTRFQVYRDKPRSPDRKGINQG
jgi:hypothetical protein